MISADITWHHVMHHMQGKPYVTRIVFWHHMISSDVIWYHMISYDIRCDEVWTRSAALWLADTMVYVWYNMISVSYDISWHNMTSCDASYAAASIAASIVLLASYDIIWHHVMSYDVRWYHMTAFVTKFEHEALHCDRPTQSCTYDIIWYDMISYSIIWYHMIHFMGRRGQLPCQAMINIWKLTSSYDVIWHHMISYDVLYI